MRRMKSSTKHQRAADARGAGAFACAWCSALLIALVGCQKTDSFRTGSGDHSPIKPADITYAELVERYNANAHPLGTLWARTDVVLEWREASDEGEGPGDTRREKGEGKLIMRRPGDVALTVEKLGKTYLWAGANNGGQYWLFDLVDSDHKAAYLGDKDTLRSPNARRLPFPVHPATVPLLLGLQPLPVEFPDATLDEYQGQYLLESRSFGLRMLIDPETFRATRVDLLNEAGYSAITAQMRGTFPVEVPGVRKTRWPSICERAQVYVAGYESRMTVAMDYATTDPRRVRDPMFDFEMLKKALKPARIESLNGP